MDPNALVGLRNIWWAVQRKEDSGGKVPFGVRIGYLEDMNLEVTTKYSLNFKWKMKNIFETTWECLQIFLHLLSKVRELIGKKSGLIYAHLSHQVLGWRRLSSSWQQEILTQDYIILAGFPSKVSVLSYRKCAMLSAKFWRMN